MALARPLPFLAPPVLEHMYFKLQMAFLSSGPRLAMMMCVVRRTCLHIPVLRQILHLQIRLNGLASHGMHSSAAVATSTMYNESAIFAIDSKLWNGALGRMPLRIDSKLIRAIQARYSTIPDTICALSAVRARQRYSVIRAVRSRYAAILLEKSFGDMLMSVDAIFGKAHKGCSCDCIHHPVLVCVHL